MKIPHLHIRILRQLILILSISAAANAWSQQFNVLSFRELPNDVSAFINPIRDLNDEDCGLLKIIANPDFVFSTPLGIVKRIDKTGEIWLYLPHGSKKITIKHSDWGVLRDYEFPSKLESHKTYEITLNYPQPAPPALANVEKIVTTVRDTLVVTRVDTIVVKPVKTEIPLKADIILGAGVGGKVPYCYGSIMAVVMKRHGVFIRISSNGTSPGDVQANCNRHGIVDGHERFYSGKTRRSLFMIGGGVIHRISSSVAIFEGLGYADTSLDWQLAPSEGGGYVRNTYFSNKGVTVEAGILLRLGRIDISASILTLKGIDWYGSVGIGFNFGKKL